MFGRFGDFVDGLNLDVAVMRTSTAAFVKKEEVSRKMSEGVSEVNDKFTKLMKDNDNDEKEEEEKKEEEKSSEISKNPTFLEKAIAKVQEDKKALAKKKAAAQEEVTDGMFDAMKEHALSNAKTDKEREMISLMFDKMKTKSNMQDVMAEVIVEFTNMTEDEEETVEEHEDKNTDTTDSEIISGPDFSGMIENPEKQNVKVEVTQEHLNKLLSQQTNAEPQKKAKK